MIQWIQKFLNATFFPGPGDQMTTLLEKLEPKFAAKVQEFLTICHDERLNVDVLAGLRTFQEQDALYAQGRSKPGKKVTNAKGGQSWHNYGLAVDIVFKVNGQWSWEETNDWTKLGMIGQQHGLEWGGAWKTSKDRPHFQYTGGLSIRDAIALHSEGGIENVWREVYRR